MRTFGKKGMRPLLLVLLICIIAAFATLTAAADEFTAAAILSADGARQDYAVMEAAVADAGPGDTLVILNDWVPAASVTFPAGVTVLIPGGVTAGNPDSAVILTVLGTLKSTGTLVGNWQLQGNVTVSWDLDGNGTVDEREVVAYGATPSHADGYRAREGMYVYNFAGWDKALAPATVDVTYTARFTRVVSDFMVGWDLDGNGTVDVRTSCAYGETPTPPADGARPDDVAKTYKFIGWDSEIHPVTTDVVYTAQFSVSPRSYTISFDTDGDGEIDKTETKVYGSPLMPEDGQKAGTTAYSFAFAGWLPALEDVTGDAVYYAQFNAVSKKDNTVAAGVTAVSMLNTNDDDVSMMVKLRSAGTVYAVKPVAVGAGLNDSVLLIGIPDGTYTLEVTDVKTGGCLYIGIVNVKDGEGSGAVMLSGSSPVFTANIDSTLNLLALDLPQSWLNREVTLHEAGLTARDWEIDAVPELLLTMKELGQDAPFRETLENAAGSQKIGWLFQITFSKCVDSAVTELTRVSEVVTILLSVPQDVLEKIDEGNGSVSVYRVGSGVTDRLTDTPNLYGEYFTLTQDGTLQLRLRSSATYALAYDVPGLGFPLWWILLLFDAAGAFVLYVDRRKKPLDYPVRLSAALGMTVVVVAILALRQGVMEIICASLGWLILTLLICLSGSGNGNRAKKNTLINVNALESDASNDALDNDESDADTENEQNDSKANQ